MEMLHNNGGSIAEALNARIYGNGTETLVLAHGYGSDQSVWHLLIPYLAVYFKIIVFDLVFSPNVNPKLYDPNKYSNFDGYAKDLIRLLDELKVDKTVYLGHSMSAMIGCSAALQRSHLFHHLVLLSGSPRYLNAKGYYGGFKRSEINTLFKSIKANYSNWVQNFAPIAVGINNTEAITFFAQSLRKMNHKVAFDVAKTVFLSDLRKILPKVSVPCTIIQSKKDIVAPELVAYYMKKKLGCHANVKILKTQGHFPHLTAHHFLLKALKQAHIIH